MATLSENITQAIEDFDSIKDAIIQKNVDIPDGTPTSEYSNKVLEIQGEDPPQGTIDIVENGSYDVSTYEEANVNVPKGIFPEGTLEITSNGDYEVSNYANAHVDVPTYEEFVKSALQGSDSSIEIPDIIETIGSGTLSNQYAVESVTIPDSVTTIEDGAFGNCVNLKYIQFPDTITFVGSTLYNTPWCSNLPAKDNYIGKVYFSYVGRMPENSSISVVPGTTQIAQQAFTNQTGLSSIEFPDSLVEISSNAFYGCTGLTSITIPEGVTSIGPDAFRFCTNLSQINFPDSLTFVGANAFEGTAWLSNQPEGVVYTGKVAYSYSGNMPANTIISIREGTVLICENAFTDQTNLVEVVLPESVVELGNSAFRRCSNLERINVPEKAQGIFAPFSGCEKLSSFSIPDGPTAVGNMGGCGITSVNLPDTVRRVYPSGFSGCLSLTSLNLNSNLISLGMYSFSRCNMSELHIPSLQCILEEGIFKRCTNLQSVTIDEGLRYLGMSMFDGCTSLSSITLPATMTLIRENAFQDTAISDVYFAGTEVQWQNMLIESGNAVLDSATIHYNYVAE